MKKVITFKLKIDEEGFHRHEIVKLENILPTKCIKVSISQDDKSEDRPLFLYVTNILEEDEVEALFNLRVYEMVFIK